MATILRRPSGRYKAIIRDPKGRYLKSKTFRRKTDAQTWARRIEADREAMAALGLAGARTRLRDVIHQLRDHRDYRDQSRPGQLRWWEAQLGDHYLGEITADMVRAALNRYTAGQPLLRDGFGPDGKRRFTARGEQRKPATVNRMKAAC